MNTLKQNEFKEENSNALLQNYVIRKIENKKYINVYINLNDDCMSIAKLEELGVKVNSRFPGILTASVPVDKLEAIAGLDEVKYIQAGSPVHKLMDNARVTTMANEVQSGLNLPGSYWGTGVVVGVIDTGLEYAHTNFYNFDKTDLRVKRVWDQNGISGATPSGFSYGTEYKTKDEIIKAKYDNKETHGTHVTGIAAGADTINNSFYGVASDAEIVLVSMNTTDSDADNVNLSDGIKYIYDYATSVGKPCVINMSLGMHIGPHDGTSTFDVICDKMQGKGRLLVGACGNEGKDNFHISKTFAANSQDSLSSFISFPAGVRQGNIDIWGEAGMKYSVQLYIYDRSKQTVKKYFDIFDASQESGNEKFYSLKSGADGAQGYISFVTEISPLNNKPHVSIIPQLSSIQNYYSIGFTIRPLTQGTVHAWSENVFSQLTNNGLEGFTKGDSECSVGEIGGTGKRIISVGAYVSKNNYKDFNGKSRNTGESLGKTASFSSIGPTADGRVKPEITAPGSTVGSSVSSYSDGLTSRIIVNKKDWNNKTYYYATMDGTSMAAPCVTGVLATWLQANNELSPEDIRAILKKTSIQDTHTGVLPEEGNNTWGYGKINAFEGIKESLKLNPQSIFSPSESVPAIIVRSTGKSEFKLLFTATLSNTTISVFDVNGKLVYNQYMGKTGAGEEVTLSLNGLNSSVYIVKATSNEVTQTSKVIIR